MFSGRSSKVVYKKYVMVLDYCTTVCMSVRIVHSTTFVYHTSYTIS